MSFTDHKSSLIVRPLAVKFSKRLGGDHAVKTFPDDDSVVPPEILEPIGRELRNNYGVLDIAVRIGRQRPGANAGLGQFEASGVPRH